MVLVTGASGLVGSFIARALVNNGFSVKALRRETSDISALDDLQDKIQWISSDILDVITLKEIVSSVDYVIHSAGMVSYHQEDKELLYQINVEGTRNLINACLDGKVKKFILISSIATFANHNLNGKPKQVNENSPQKLDNLKTNYAKAKFFAEMEAWRGKTEGLFTMVVNPSVVLGPGNWHESSTRLFRYVYDENKFFIDTKVNYIDVRDLAYIVVNLLQRGNNGDQYIASAGSISYKELFEKMASCFDKKPPSIKTGNFMLRLGYWLSQLKSLITFRRASITKEIISSGNSRVFYSNDKIKQDLLLEFRSIDDTINWSCEQLKAKV